MKPSEYGIVLLVGAFIVACLIVPDVIQLNNCDKDHEAIISKIEKVEKNIINQIGVKDSVEAEWRDRLIKENGELQLRIIDK